VRHYVSRTLFREFGSLEESAVEESSSVIRLIGVLTQGGVPIKVKSSADAEGDLIVGPLIEATKALSEVMGSGEVKRLAFKDNTLIVTESKKGYTVVALVSKAEDYMDSLLRVIADAVDDSRLPDADGTVMDLHSTVIEDIVSPYVKSHVEGSFPEIFDALWEPLVEKMRRAEPYTSALDEVDGLIELAPSYERWSDLEKSTSGSLADALRLAERGSFDKACALAMKETSPAARVFSVKMGALTHSMTKATAPPLDLLREIVQGLPRDYPFANLAKTLVEYIAGTAIPADYSRAFREAVGRFEFVDDDEHRLVGFIFLDPRIVEYGEFHRSMLDFYEDRSEVFCHFIEAIDERGKLFDKLYSITSYEAFRDDLGVYKARIKGILSSVRWILDPSLFEELAREGKAIEIGISSSLRLQNYIALLTALAESPVLTISERKSILEEVLMLYRDYFSGLMSADVPLFTYTLDSVFQSISVAHAEYYMLSAGSERDRHLQETVGFLNDVFETIKTEWSKAGVRFSLFVVANAICPIMTRASISGKESTRLVYLASSLQDLDTIDASQVTRPMTYATNVGNAVNTLTALAVAILDEGQKPRLLKLAIETTLDVFEWFLSHGVVCRDDIVSGTYHLTLASEYFDDETLEGFVARVTALNRIVIQDPEKYDYELAMMAGPLIDTLNIAYKRFGHRKYREMAEGMYLLAHDAWQKYGFDEKAENFRKKYPELQP
jgi:hypothetical protein